MPVLTVFDYLVLFVLFCSILLSMFNGLVKEILSLCAWVAAFLVANAYGDPLAKLLPESVSGETMRLIVAYLALFIGVRLLMLLLSKVLEGLIKAGGLTVADRGLGGVFGLAKGIVIVLAGVLLCGMTAIPQQPLWRNALFSPLAETAARTVKPFLPVSFARHIRF